MDLTYKDAGVDTHKQDDAMAAVFARLRQTWHARGHVELDFGHFANVINLGEVGIAISTDGIGTKAIIAQLMGKYDTVGIDCVAINANDVLCVGAEPQSLVDYIAVQRIDQGMVADVATGLAEGGRLANLSIAGGESAQLPELLQGEEEGGGFDLAGTCIGTVTPGSVIAGRSIEPRDVIVGLASSGVHCNGLTLARQAFGVTRDKGLRERRAAISRHQPELGASLGETLLTPTRIYVAEVLSMLRGGVDVRGIAHITQDGFLNLPRLEADVGYVIDAPQEPQPIFQMVQAAGGVSDGEMYEVFNMGTGMCVIVAEGDAGRAIEMAGSHGAEASAIGHVVEDASRTVEVPPLSLRGRRGEGFRKA